VFENLQTNHVPFTCLGKFAAYRVLLEKQLFTSWSKHFDLVEYAGNSIRTFWHGSPEKVYEIYKVPETHRSEHKYFEALKYLSSPYDPLLILSIADPQLFDGVRIGQHYIIGGDADHHGVQEPNVVIKKIDSYISYACSFKASTAVPNAMLFAVTCIAAFVTAKYMC
jgi:hypothetical protein